MSRNDVNAEGFARRLADFLGIVQQSIPNLNTAPWHLGFPAGGPVLLGSDLGRQVWATPKGQRLIEYLLSDPLLGEWFAPPPEASLTELRFCVASVVEQWAESAVPAEEFAAERASEILDAIRAPQIVCTGVTLVYGIGLDQRPIGLPYGLAIHPATPDTLATILPRLGASVTDVIRAPKRPALVLLSRIAASRTEMRGFAASWADGDCRIWLERLRTAIWLTSGVLPARGDMYLYHESPYPAIPFERISPTPEQRFPGQSSPGGEVSLDGAFLSDVLVRMGGVWGTTEPHLEGEAIEALWVAEGTYLHQALEVADASSTVLMAYAAMDGLLRNEKEHDSVVIRRVGALIGRSDKDRRAVRRFIERLQRIRGAVAHGKRPRLADVGEAIDRQVSREELVDRGIVADRELNLLLRARCLNVLRRVLVSFLWLTVEGEPWSGAPHRPRAGLRLSRQQVLETLDSAHKGVNDAVALLETKIPAVLRGRVLP